MREILFRGFHPCDGPETIVVEGEKVKGEWVYGNLFVNKLTGQHMIIAPNKEIDRFDYITVTPSTVGQYTGLTDKNGRRIFEGDILSIKNPKPFVPWISEVMYEDCCFWLKDNRGVIRMLADYADSEAEVIGTVFDEEAHNAKN